MINKKTNKTKAFEVAFNQIKEQLKDKCLTARDVKLGKTNKTEDLNTKDYTNALNKFQSLADESTNSNQNLVENISLTLRNPILKKRELEYLSEVIDTELSRHELLIADKWENIEDDGDMF